MQLAVKIIEDLRDFSSLVTTYGFVACSMSNGDDYREFDASDVRRFADAID